jgi:hypothetical protein
MDFQKNIVDYLRNKTIGKSQLAQELTDILHISQESVYRRLRCETAFTADEVAILAGHFHFSLDELITNNPSGRISVRFQSLFKQEKVFIGYLDSVIKTINRVKEEKGSITYVARDLPISQSFQNQTLREFKIYYWTRVVLNRPPMQGYLLGDTLDLGPINTSIDKLLNHYKHTNRVEFWSEDTVNSTLRQINYCYEFGLFRSDADCIAVLESLISVLNHIEKSLDQQENIPSFQFYVSEVELSNNYIFLKHDEKRLVFLSFNTFNSLASYNPSFCDEVEQMIYHAKTKSVLISGQSDISRKKYFNKMRKKVNDYKGGMGF